MINFLRGETFILKSRKLLSFYIFAKIVFVFCFAETKFFTPEIVLIDQSTQNNINNGKEKISKSVEMSCFKIIFFLNSRFSL